MAEQREISAAEFLELIPSGRIENYRIIERVSIGDDINFHEWGLDIVNCHFLNTFIIEKTNVDRIIHLELCDFKGGLLFKDCISTVIDNILDDECGIEIVKSTISTLRFSGKNELSKGVLISKTTILNMLIFDDLNTDKVLIYTSKIGQINFKNPNIKFFEINYKSEVKSLINIQKDTKIFSLKFIDTIFDMMFSVNYAEIISFRLTGCEFKDDFNLFGAKIDGLQMDNNIFNKAVIIRNNTSPSFPSKITSLKIYNCEFIDGFFLIGNNSKLDSLRVNFSNKLIGTMSFKNLDIMDFEVRGTNKNVNFLLQDSNIKILSFNEFDNNSSFKLSNILASDYSTLTINNSNLSKNSFYNFNFDSFNKIEIESSIVSDIQTANVIWFRPNKLKSDHKTKREVFRQLKYASEKQSNKVDALMFHSYEMEEHRKELKAENEKDLEPKPYISNFADRFILCASKTNDYGQNWFKPLILLSVFTFVFYVFIILAVVDNVNFCTCKGSTNAFVEYAHIIPQMIDPTHSITKLFDCEKLKNSHSVYWIDAIYKLFLGFFLFQIISAFRKFVK